MAYKKNYFVNYHNIAPNQKLDYISIFEFLEDIAISHCDDLNIGLDFLYQRNLAWFVRKWQVEILELPKYRDYLQVVTNPYALYNFYGYRKFDINHNNKAIITADSEWIFFNTKDKKPITIPESIEKRFNSKQNKIKFFNLNPLDNFDKIFEYRPMNFDLDTNYHINNKSYLKYFLNSLELDFLNNHTLKNIKIIYRKEADFNSNLIVKLKFNISGNLTICSCNIFSNDELTTLIETIWKEN